MGALLHRDTFKSGRSRTMRLKTFHDKSMQAVMQKVRESMGPDAIIISVDEGSGVAGVRVTAALEGTIGVPVPETAPRPDPSPNDYDLSHPTPLICDYDQADLKAVLSHHDIPNEILSRLYEAIDKLEVATLVEAISGGLEATLNFAPLTDFAARPIILVGPPGAGKTVCTAKLAASARLHQRSIRLITTDTVKSGGVAQLDHFAQIMRLSVQTAETPDELKAVLKTDRHWDLSIIDTSGVNPFDMDDLAQSLKFIKASQAEPILVMPSGLNAYDAQEMAKVFASMGGRRFIATKMDASRRYGSVVAAARRGYLSLAAYSRTPFIAEGLESASSMGLARLLAALPQSGSGRRM